MLAQAVVEFFKYKVVGSIIILTCWPAADQMKFSRQISRFGLSSTFSCDHTILDDIDRHRLQGVIYITLGHNDDIMFKKIKSKHFFTKYKWLIVGDQLPDALRNIRYDADVAFLKYRTPDNSSMHDIAVSMVTQSSKLVEFHDVYVHPNHGVAVHSWAYWTPSAGFVPIHDRQRILRRMDLKRYPLRIATPVGHYSSENYNGTFMDWLNDDSLIDQDPGIRTGYHTSKLLAEIVNAEDVLLPAKLWVAKIDNNSTYMLVSRDEAELAGGVFRILWDRIYVLDYVVAIWPFRVGFTYLAERESSSNMFVEPFSPGVWWSCLAMIGLLAMVQRVTSKSRKEQDGALYTVLTTYLQQDASAVPQGLSGRWAFTVLSVSAMLVHAYYTSAIVSALMSAGRGGPETLTALADSKYTIAAEDYDDMRYLFFDVKSIWDDVEYLKKKKMTSNFYQTLERGVELIQQGGVAFHSEYNQIYPYFKTYSDNQICMLQHVDTIPESLTWVTSNKDGQWSNTLRTAGLWLLETGNGNRLVTRLIIPQPPCRAALLAERVKLGDVGSLIVLSICGAVLSVIILGIEIIFAKAQRTRGAVLGSDKKPALKDGDNDVSEDLEYLD